MESKVALTIGAPFSIDEKTFVLAPRAEKEVVVTIAATSAGSAQSVLKVAADGGGFDIPIEAGISSISAPAAASRRPPAPSPTRRESTEPEPATESSFVSSGQFAATIISAGENSATFRWQGAITPGAKPRCLVRSLAIGEDGGLVSTFVEYAACQIVQREGANLATVEKLEPGTNYLFRIEAVTGEGSTPVTFAQFRTTSPPARAPIFTITRVLIAFALIAGGVSIWQRTRSRRIS